MAQRVCRGFGEVYDLGWVGGGVLFLVSRVVVRHFCRTDLVFPERSEADTRYIAPDTVTDIECGRGRATFAGRQAPGDFSARPSS